MIILASPIPPALAARRVTDPELWSSRFLSDSISCNSPSSQAVPAAIPADASPASKPASACHRHPPTTAPPPDRPLSLIAPATSTSTS
ncbi:hypothetical protein VTO73DRAFT_326 [Trametes versicolor]